MRSIHLAIEAEPAARRSEFLSLEPATGHVLWRGGASDVPAAIAAARTAFPHWACQPLANRIEIARRFGAELRRNATPLAEIIARETGRPLWDTYAEVESVLSRVDTSVRAYADRCAMRKHDGGAQGGLAIRHKPLGVLAVITPFSQPAAAAINRIIPAMIGGNAVLFKPSEKALATAALLVDCAMRAGLPAGLLQLVVGDGDTGLALATAEDIDGVLFCGSAPVGQILARRLAGRPERLLSLDLGGNNPLVVWDTPAIEDAAVLVVQSAFTAAGQRCTAARRLIVRDELAEPLLNAVKRLADRIICGAPFDEPTPFMGPVIDAAAADGLTQSFIWLMSNGGRPIKHMVRLHDTLPFISPAIIDVTDMGVARADVEVFGPLLQVIRVPTFDAAIAEANATRYGLVAGLIGGTQAEYNMFWANVRAGVIHWNRPTISELPAAPLGGVGMSGNFRPSGYYAADCCAYPVSSAEIEAPRALIGTGFAAEV